MSDVVMYVVSEIQIHKDTEKQECRQIGTCRLQKGRDIRIRGHKKGVI